MLVSLNEFENSAIFDALFTLPLPPLNVWSLSIGEEGQDMGNYRLVQASLIWNRCVLGRSLEPAFKLEHIVCRNLVRYKRLKMILAW